MKIGLEGQSRLSTDQVDKVKSNLNGGGENGENRLILYIDIEREIEKQICSSLGDFSAWFLIYMNTTVLGQ